MELWVGAMNLGCLYTFLAIGIWITFRIYNYADITVDGTFTAGASITALLIVAGLNPFLTLPVAFGIGAAGGLTAAFIHTRFKIDGLLAGILVMTGLYSINLRIMGKSNIPLLSSPSFITAFEGINPGIPHELWICICLIPIMLLFWAMVSLFFRTDLGITMRATGNNPIMVSASGVSVNAMKILGISMANGLAGLSGGLVAQYQGFSDIGMGIGSIIFGLAAVIIGEAIFQKESVWFRVISVWIGSVLFRMMVALALFVGLNPNDLKLITALFVLLTLIASTSISGGEKGARGSIRWIPQFNRKWRIGTAILIGLIFAGVLTERLSRRSPWDHHLTKIGIVLPNDSEILTKTRDGFLDEMKAVGYKDGQNIQFLEQNANGDLSAIPTIIDHMNNQKVDIYLAISTASTQAVINKIKDKPVVFATVANPFIIGAGKSDRDHPPNVSGVYGAMPLKEMMGMIRQVFKGELTLGTLWNPAFANSVYNVDQLKKAVEADQRMKVKGATITGTAEVYEAAASLTHKGIDAFVLVPDIMVFAAFESVVKAARSKNIPIITADVERLMDGSLLICGYEYYVSGIQAAHMVDRIIKGESPQNIPFEQYKVIERGVNYDLARQFGISIPESLEQKVTMSVKDGRLHRLGERERIRSAPNESAIQKEKKKIRLAVFQFIDNQILDLVVQGGVDAIKKSGVLEEYDLTIDFKTAQGGYGNGQAIAKDIVAKKYDYIFTASTLALQIMANQNRKIPHVFGAVTDPIKAGVGKNFDDHFSNLTGLATAQPVEAAIKQMREFFPGAKSIGLIWNTAEANSEYCTLKARDAVKKYGFQLIEKTISSTGEVEEALRAIIAEKVDLFLTSGDVTVMTAVPSIAKRLLQKKIPYFTNSPDDVTQGSFFGVGADYYDVGVMAGRILVRVIRGEDPAKIPILNYVPMMIGVNLGVAKDLGVAVPEALLKKAKKVVR